MVFGPEILRNLNGLVEFDFHANSIEDADASAVGDNDFLDAVSVEVGDDRAEPVDPRRLLPDAFDFERSPIPQVVPLRLSIDRYTGKDSSKCKDACSDE
ncbi:MAG: hypothetical protein FJY67_10395 [Calditrichaeota bacterium]|nr:hypothetical protein [Calditrichota bacterium]